MSLKKPCKFCGKLGHWPYQCFDNPKPRKYIKQLGKAAEKWFVVRRAWFEAHPQASYICYICGKVLLPAETTLDHVIPKSNAKNYANRHDFSNLKPCCFSCNNEKGSKH